ncbi:hypothetical protein [Aureliella helgolandensis]|nr:hypothetical protein [Aureliella helgolandensis]
MLCIAAVSIPPSHLAAQSDVVASAIEAEPHLADSDQVQVVTGSAKFATLWHPQGVAQYAGTIIDFDANLLVLRTPDNQEMQFQSDRVLHIAFQWRKDEARQASDLVADRQYQAAVTAIQSAYKSGIPQWQQRILIGQLVQALAALEKSRTAGVLFLNLADAHPPAMLYADMPLCWTAREPDAALLKTALDWLNSDSESAQLLGASWLLMGPHRSQAEEALRKLKSSENSTVSQLAAAQAWRSVPPPDTMKYLAEWFEFRDGLLEPLQLGPSEFLAERLMRIGQDELAIGQWVRIGTIHRDRYHRAAAALNSAAQQLQRNGMNQEAQKLHTWITELSPQQPTPQ